MMSVTHFAMTVVALTAVVGSPLPAACETKRAVLVGIDTYTNKAQAEASAQTASAAAVLAPSRGTWFDLDGAVNDADAMAEILIHRFGFAPEQTHVLRNREATHAAILEAVRTQLVEPAQRGDVSVFFYAGHGSQVRDSRSPKGQRDESIVPADAPSGGWDIADKELQALFNDALDKGVLLTAFFDSCHSGAIARGLPAGRGLPAKKVRMVPPDDRDYAERLGRYWEDPRASPWTRGLFFEAATAEQLAKEGPGEDKRPHGAFTVGLLRTLPSVPVNTPAQDVFMTVKARVAEMSDQLPQLEATAERKRQPLFATTTGMPPQLSVKVGRVEDDGTVELLGGQALGLDEGCELRKVGARDAGNPVRLRVETVPGLGTATARIVAGTTKEVAAGDQFEIDLWSTRLARLRIWQAPPLEPEALEKMVSELPRLKQLGATWVDDPSVTTPTHVAWWDGEAWKLVGPQGRSVRLGTNLQTDSVRDALRERPDAKLFVSVPAGKGLAAALGKTLSAEQGLLASVERREEADYFLVGRLAPADDSGRAQIEYALVRPDSADDNQHRSSLPARTDWLRGSDDDVATTAGRFKDVMLRLSKVNSWLHLDSPGGDAALFPYRLVLRRNGRDVSPDDVLCEGNQVTMVLRADPERLTQEIARRYVYVMALDSWGKSTLLFPRSGGGGINLLPFAEQLGKPPSEIALLDGDFETGPPYGMDTYLMFASWEEVPDTTVFQHDGVRTEEQVKADKKRGGATALGALLANVDSTTRGVGTAIPTHWSLQRFAVRSEKQTPAGHCK
jgi:hypothetical protein